MRDMLHSLLIGVFLVAAAPAKTFTLEQVLSAPFPYELTAAPGGGKVAWLLNESGARNVWMASAPDFKGVRLTNYIKDDGQDVGQLCWTPDGKSVVYVRGGDLEFLGRPDPNPAADPAGVDQAIWIATPGEAPRKIAGGHSPMISPKGDRIAYLLGGQIWVAPIAGGSAAPLLHPRSGVTAGEVRWSPDGSKLAYVSDRGNHSFIAVYDFGSQVAELPGSQRGPGRQPCVVARRQAGGVHTHDERHRRRTRRTAGGRPLEHSRGECGRWNGAAGLEVRPGSG